MKNIYTQTKVGKELKSRFEKEVLKEESVGMDFLSAFFHLLFILQLIALATAASISSIWIFDLSLGIDLANAFANLILGASFIFSMAFIFITRFYTQKKRMIVKEWRRFKTLMKKLGLEKVIVYSEFLYQDSAKNFIDAFSIFGFLSNRQMLCLPNESLQFAKDGVYVFHKLRKMGYEFIDTVLWPELTK